MRAKAKKIEWEYPTSADTSVYGIVNLMSLAEKSQFSLYIIRYKNRNTVTLLWQTAGLGGVVKNIMHCKKITEAPSIEEAKELAQEHFDNFVSALIE